MADIVVYSAVRSKAGRDKNRYFAVVSLDGDYAYISDGDLRKLSKPKRKKLKHLAATNTVFTPVQLLNDKVLYKTIKERYYTSDCHQ